MQRPRFALVGIGTIAALGLGIAHWSAYVYAQPKPVPKSAAKPETVSALPQSVETVAQWIWYPEDEPTKSAPAGSRYFRRVFKNKQLVETADFEITADDAFELFLNGKQVGSGRLVDEAKSPSAKSREAKPSNGKLPGESANLESLTQPGQKTPAEPVAPNSAKTIHRFDLSSHFVAGDNILAIKATNDTKGPAGLMVSANIRTRSGPSEWLLSDKQWRTSNKAADGWLTSIFDDGDWQPARELGPFGKTEPWGAIGGNLLAGRRFDVPAGFVVERVAEPNLTGSVVRFQFDSLGRPMISREGGATLFKKNVDPGQGDTFILDGRTVDGRYTKAWTYSDKVKDCQGYFDLHGVLYCVGVGPEGPGLYKQTGKPGGSADSVELLKKTTGEYEYHGPHQVLYGPDGHLYLCIANRAGAAPYAKNSPHQHWYEGQLLSSWPDPRSLSNRNIKAPGGVILRATDNTAKDWTLEAGGFRNQYGFGFDRTGEIWSWDSDHEPDLDLPWYRPNRINFVPRGAELGWRNGTGCWPDYYPDSLPAAVNIGRGSPTGMTFYHHHAYPKKYRGALFACDWSLGRIVVVYPKHSGAGATATFEDFVVGRPMTVTDIDVGPDGHLYFCTGGANTEGGLYRIRYVSEPMPDPLAGVDSPLDRAILQPQPESAWALAEIAKQKLAAGKSWNKQLRTAALDGKRNNDERLRAITLMLQFGPAVDVAMIAGLIADNQPAMRARAMWLAGELTVRPASQNGTPHAALDALKLGLDDENSLVRRRALEGLLRLDPLFRNGDDLDPRAVVKLCGDADRYVRFAAHTLLKRVPADTLRPLVLSEENPQAAAYAMLAFISSARDANDAEALFRHQFTLLQTLAAKQEPPSAETLIELCRAVALTIQLAEKSLDKFHQEERTAWEPWPIAQAVGALLNTHFPHADYRVNRELVRVCVSLERHKIRNQVLVELKKGLSREQQVHYALCLSFDKRTWTAEERQQMLDWYCNMQSWNGGTATAGYIDLIFDHWLKNAAPEHAEAYRQQRLARKPKEVETLPLKPAESKYAFDKLVDHLESHRGDATRGTALLTRARCLACHRFGTQGEAAAPDLTAVGKRFQRKEIAESLIYPNKVIADQFKGATYLLNDGRLFSGMPISETTDAVTIILPDTKKLTLKKTDIDETTISEHSIMPQGLLNELTLDEIADLFALLERGPG